MVWRFTGSCLIYKPRHFHPVALDEISVEDNPKNWDKFIKDIEERVYFDSDSRLLPDSRRSPETQCLGTRPRTREVDNQKTETNS